MTTMSYPNPKLTEHLMRNCCRIISMEVTYACELDYAKLKEIKHHFLSVVWTAPFDLPPSKIPPIQLARKLIESGEVVVLHVPSRFIKRDQVKDIFDYLRDMGLRNVMICRGEIPDRTEFDFPYPLNLIEYVNANYPEFEIGACVYLYPHPDSTGFDDDIQRLKEKADAGVRFAITQAAFAYDRYAEMRDAVRRVCGQVELIPGVYAFDSTAGFKTLASFNKTPRHPGDEIYKFVCDCEGRNWELLARKAGRDAALDVAACLRADRAVAAPHIFTLKIGRAHV